jgi:hypothetical protein
MKSKGMIFVLALAAMFCFYGTVLADGGGPEDPGSDCACFDTMDIKPTSGPFIWGEFTVARDRDAFGVECNFEDGFENCDHFNVHVTLRRFGEVHLFHTFRRVATDIANGTYNICDLSDADLKGAYERLACDLNVEEYFELAGTPVIYYLNVTEKECLVTTSGGDTAEQMIKGTIILRVVPTVSCGSE